MMKGLDKGSDKYKAFSPNELSWEHPAKHTCQIWETHDWTSCSPTLNLLQLIWMMFMRGSDYLLKITVTAERKTEHCAHRMIPFEGGGRPLSHIHTNSLFSYSATWWICSLGNWKDIDCVCNIHPPTVSATIHWLRHCSVWIDCSV